jgi:hypothetical protein
VAGIDLRREALVVADSEQTLVVYRAERWPPSADALTLLSRVDHGNSEPLA